MVNETSKNQEKQGVDVQKILHKVYSNSDIRDQEQLADYLRVHSSTITRWKQRKSIPAAHVASLSRLAGMPREQLTGAGAPRLPDGMSTITVNVQGERVDELVTDSPVIGVVLGQQDMAARHLTRYKSVQRISPWLNALGRPAQERGEGLTMRLDSLEVMGEAESMRVMRMQGDDMAPAIMPGDDLLVDTSKTRAVHGRVFVVAVGDSALVRRCIMSSKGPHWRGSPDGHWNEIEDARIVGQVLRLCREL